MKQNPRLTLACQVVFKACWLSDFAMMSMDGTVSFKDFTTNLVKDLDLKDSETEVRQMIQTPNKN